MKEEKNRNKSFSGLNREVMSYGIDTTQFKVSSSDQVDYMNSYGQVHVKRYSKIFGSLIEADCRVSNNERVRKGHRV